MGDISSHIRLKRVYDPWAASDGYRVLATRFWPRGITRDATDEYISNLAPSRQLLNAYSKGPLPWAEFEQRYREELLADDKQEELRRLAKIARSRIVTLLCFCKDEKGCHRTLLREAIIKAG
jgi:uncharacterized protein YeaO (DUF488 family)